MLSNCKKCIGVLGIMAASQGLSIGLQVPLLSVARADEFATVPANDALYKHLATVQRAGWSGAARVDDTSSVGAMTRYEMSLETARAYFAVTARQRANAQWKTTASRPAIRALRELLVSLRGELKKLDVNVNEALTFCDNVLKSGQATIALSSTPVTAPTIDNRAVANDTLFTSRRRNVGLQSTLGLNRSTEMLMPLSQRLRVHAALSSLARASDDPFGDATTSSLNSAGAASGISATGRAAYDVSSWLRLRADFEKHALLPNTTDPSRLLNSTNTASPLLLRSLNANATSGRSLGGGVDIELLRGLTLSGEVARLTADGATDAVRFGGGVGLTAWQNRLSLSANLSRLVPQEDSAVLSSTAAALNLDVGMTERLKLRLLYQQLFGSPTQMRNDRIVAGGLNISF